jgi:hypothetical protein
MPMILGNGLPWCGLAECRTRHDVNDPQMATNEHKLNQLAGLS